LTPRDRKLGLVLIVLVILILVIIAYFAAVHFSEGPASTVKTTTPLNFCCGVGEDYELAWTYQTIPSNLTHAWINYYINSTFESFKAKFGWDIVRLAFRFDPNASSSAEQFLNITNFSNLNQAISIASKYGFKVILDDADYQTGFYGSFIWYHDWNVTTEHFKGDSNVAFFEIANEMEDSNTGGSNNGCGGTGTEGIVCLDKLTDDIHAIDPSRVVAWWAYSLPAYHEVPPASELRPNLYIDMHMADYFNSTACLASSTFENSVKELLSFQNETGKPVIAGELNMQMLGCTSLGSKDIQYLVQQNVPWIAWGFKTYFTEWVSILDNVNVG
jgi:hypothetical protein